MLLARGYDFFYYSFLHAMGFMGILPALVNHAFQQAPELNPMGGYRDSSILRFIGYALLSHWETKNRGSLGDKIFGQSQFFHRIRGARR